MNMLEKLKKILDENKDKRICILGTTCTGKTTLINELGYCLDMDEEIFPLLTKEESDYVCQTPWTEEIGEYMDKLVREKLSINPGKPIFGTVLLDCDLIIYLHISDELLFERTKIRNVNAELGNLFDGEQSDSESFSSTSSEASSGTSSAVSSPSTSSFDSAITFVKVTILSSSFRFISFTPEALLPWTEMPSTAVRIMMPAVVTSMISLSSSTALKPTSFPVFSLTL